MRMAYRSAYDQVTKAIMTIIEVPTRCQLADAAPFLSSYTIISFST